MYWFPEGSCSLQKERSLTLRGVITSGGKQRVSGCNLLDKRPVYIISTAHPSYVHNKPGKLLEVICQKPDGTEVHVPCPPAEFDYQQHMGGVHRVDQVMKAFNVPRQSRKTWKKLFS